MSVDSQTRQLLGDLVTHQKGFAFKSKDYKESGNPVVRVSNFTADSISSGDLKYVNDEVAHLNASVALREGDVVIATVGSWPKNPASIVGKTVSVPLELAGALLNQNSVRLRAKTNNSIDQEYLFYALKSPRFSDYLVSTAQGSANQASITLKDIFSYEVEWPDQPVRSFIASVLGGIRRKIQINNQVNETLEQMAQAIFKSWFVDFEPVKAKIAARERWHSLQGGNEPASPVCYAGALEGQPIDVDLDTYMNVAAIQAISGKDAEQLERMQAEKPEEYAELCTAAELFPSSMQDSELGEIPEGWAIGPIGRLCDVRKGLSYKGRHIVNDDSQPAMINLGNFGGGGAFKAEKLKRYNGDHKSRHTVSAGQLLVANTDMTQNRVILGSPIIAPDVGATLLFTHHTFAVDFKSDYPESEWRNYVFHWCLQPSFRARAEGFATGTTVLALPKDAFLKCDIVIASHGVVSAFNSRVRTAIAKHDSLNAQNSTLTKIRDTLLPKLLSGELVPENVHEGDE